MNQRIKELALEAGGSHYPDVNTKQLERFAELIVKECADMVDRAISDGGVDGRILKEHFGVEL